MEVGSGKLSHLLVGSTCNFAVDLVGFFHYTDAVRFSLAKQA